MAVEATTYEPPPKRRWRVSRIYYGWYVLFGMVVALIVAEGVTIGSLSAYTEPLENHFGWSRRDVSMGFSVTVGTIGLFAPFIGRLIDVVGPRRLMLIGAPLCAAAFVLLAFMTQLWQWYVYLGVSSLALGLIAYIPAQALAVRWFDRRRATALSLIGASVWMGQMAMLPLVQVIISRLGWEDAFIYSGMLVVGAYIVAFIFVRDQPRANESDAPTATTAAASSEPIALSGMTIGQTMRTPLFWALVLGLMLLYFVVFGWLSQGVPYYQSVGFSDFWAAQIISLTAGGAVVWLLLAGPQIERFRRPELVAAFGALFVCASLLVLLCDRRGRNIWSQPNGRRNRRDSVRGWLRGGAAAGGADAVAGVRAAQFRHDHGHGVHVPDDRDRLLADHRGQHLRPRRQLRPGADHLRDLRGGQLRRVPGCESLATAVQAEVTRSGRDQDHQKDDGDREKESVGQNAGASGVHVIHRFCLVVTFPRSNSRVRRTGNRCSATVLGLLSERQQEAKCGRGERI